MGGASLVAFGLFVIFPEVGESPKVLSVFAAAAWICNYPHFAATNYRLYRSRASIHQYPMTATLTPVVMFFAVIACYVSPNVVAPQFVLLYMLWSPYHYAGQTIGLTMVYARRSRVDITGSERKAFVTFSMLTVAASVAAAQEGTGKHRFFGVTYTPLGLPEWVSTLL
ncbi:MULTISPECIES: hypothetical protein, partial [unclassified Frankia]|uniref:hypothetical protein n=1 Tax=unclassified Frankia TaxID=2632575 RepID=UPI002AD45E88